MFPESETSNAPRSLWTSFFKNTKMIFSTITSRSVSNLNYFWICKADWYCVFFWQVQTDGGIGKIWKPISENKCCNVSMAISLSSSPNLILSPLFPSSLVICDWFVLGAHNTFYSFFWPCGISILLGLLTRAYSFPSLFFSAKLVLLLWFSTRVLPPSSILCISMVLYFYWTIFSPLDKHVSNMVLLFHGRYKAG